MNWGRLTPLVAAWVGLVASSPAGDVYTPGEAVKGTSDSLGLDFLANHCFDCHDADTAKGDLNLDTLSAPDETNTGIWKSVWAQVALGEMPPEKRRQPETVESLRFTDWIVRELGDAMKDNGGFNAHLDPHKGNFIDHDLLFGTLPDSIRLTPTSSPARIWRVTPQEHITRLNELINTEPPFDPSKPGLRSHGDVVPTNHGGELKLYFGTDRITRWDGGTVAYATAVKSIPAVLSSRRKHGFGNYPDFYSVNSAEATQILNKAEDLLRYMAYGPMSLTEFPEQITDDPSTYDAVKPRGDLRGLPSSLVYNTKVVRPITPVYDLMKDQGDTSDDLLRSAVNYIFEAVTFRPPTKQESSAYIGVVENSIAKVGKEDGAFMGLSSIFLDRDALFRPETARHGTPDKHGRVMLQDWELGLAVNHALCYIRPDAQLRDAITSGRMRSRDDVGREISRMLGDDRIRKPRITQFFREFFDHDLAGYICKDQKALRATGAPEGSEHYRAMFDQAASTDRLIELILSEDRDVLKELLTTQKVVSSGKDRIYLGRKLTAEERKTASAAKREADQKVKEGILAELQSIDSQIATHTARLDDPALDQKAVPTLRRETRSLEKARNRLKNDLKRKRSKINATVAEADLAGEAIYARVSRKSFGNSSMAPERTLSTVPEGERLGVLTHPSWLVSHSDAMDNHAILRGRWIRERLLGGGIPDVPITVDAQLPDEPGTTLRHRMRVTRERYCWTCHAKMDPLGLPFEIYNHAGLYRTTEFERPVDASGEIIESGDPSLDGPVENALDMIQRLAGSERVEQVFVRHAFRFWMGRNETLNDAPVLQEAHRTYRDSGGSMKALIKSLVTSDAFLYRSVDRGSSP